MDYKSFIFCTKVRTARTNQSKKPILVELQLGILF